VRAGFSLIEMMAVVLFTGIVLVAAVDFYLDLAAASRGATDLSRTARRGVALLDKLARDLETAYLVKKPEERDPFEHPWVFVAESRSSDHGSDHLRFSRRGRIPRLDDAQESDLEVVAYSLVASEERDGAFDLVRWSSPRLPDGLDRTYPTPDDEGAFVLARDVGAFGVRFLDEEGAWHDAWDSSQLVESSELPSAAEITVAVLPEGLDPEFSDDFAPPAPSEVLSRVVVIPMRPVDLEELLGSEAPGEDDDEDDCVTVDECRARNPEVFENVDVPGLDLVGDGCWSDHAGSFPAAVLSSVQGCQDPELEPEP
jgi:type II secretory pathway component PulJ